MNTLVGMLVYVCVLGAVLVLIYALTCPPLIPKLPRGERQEKKIAGGDCPEENCGGRTYMISAESFATLWRCVECRTSWLLGRIES